MEHTKLPWDQEGQKISAYGRGTICICPSPISQNEGVLEFIPNAKFIAKACNSHEALLAVCIHTKAILASITQLGDSKTIATLVIELHQAIAKAEAE